MSEKQFKQRNLTFKGNRYLISKKGFNKFIKIFEETAEGKLKKKNLERFLRTKGNFI